MNINCRNSSILMVAGLLLAPISSTPLNAQENTPDASNKFQMITKDEGIIRLNTQTGKTSFCRMISGNLVCNVAKEERDVLESEITKLQKQIAALEAKSKPENSEQALNETAPQAQAEKPNSKSDKEIDRQFDKLDKELGRALDLTKRTVRRFFDAVKGLQRDWKES